MVHGRMPVFNDDAVIGMVLRSDILRKAAADEFEPTMADVMRPIKSVLSGSTIDAAMRSCSRTGSDPDGGGGVRDDNWVGYHGGRHRTLLGVEIVDEADIEGIQDGAVREDMRELAMIRRGRGEPQSRLTVSSSFSESRPLFSA